MESARRSNGTTKSPAVFSMRDETRLAAVTAVKEIL
jgi:hypothetical protein